MSFFPSNISRVELRKAPRRGPHDPALIDHGDGMPPLNCTISDVSELGAKLTVAAQDRIPDQFTLLLSNSGGGRRSCRVIWRSQLEIGVEFVPDPQTASTSTATSASDKTQLDC